MPEIEVDADTTQFAMFMQARDARQFGYVTADLVQHPTWDEADVIGQAEYLKDAAAYLVQHPRWDEADVIGQAEYLKDAAAYLAAVELLGYAAPARVMVLAWLIEHAIVALNEPDDTENVPDSNEWADQYRVKNALRILTSKNNTTTEEGSTNDET